MTTLVSPGLPRNVATLQRALPSWSVVGESGIVIPGDDDPPPPIVIADNVEPTLSGIVAAVRELRNRFPHSPVAVYVRVQDHGAHALLRARCAGTCGVLYEGIDDQRGAAHTAITQSHGVEVWRAVAAALPADLPDLFVRTLAHCVIGAAYRWSVAEVAAHMQILPRTVDYRLSRIGMENVMNVYHWGVALVIAYDLERGYRPLSDVVTDLAYRQHRSVRNAVRERLGCTLSDLSMKGAFAPAIAALVAAVRLPARAVISSDAHPGVIELPPRITAG